MNHLLLLLLLLVGLLGCADSAATSAPASALVAELTEDQQNKELVARLFIRWVDEGQPELAEQIVWPESRPSFRTYNSEHGAPSVPSVFTIKWQEVDPDGQGKFVALIKEAEGVGFPVEKIDGKWWIKL